MTHHRGFRAPAIVWLLVPCIAGCPVPLARTEALSASLVGSLHYSNGTPVAGAQVVVTTDYADTACARVAGRTVTDSAGGFRLAGIQQRYRVTWVIPNFDRAAPTYRVCASVSDTLRPAYRGQGSLTPTVPRDSLTCVQWVWRGRPQITCSRGYERLFATGGAWHDQADSGWFRLIVRPQDHLRNHRPRAFIQWVTHSSPTHPGRVKVMLELPLGSDAAWPTELVEEPVLTYWGGRWCASVLVTTDGLFSAKQRPFTFALGAPGEAHLVPQC